MNFLEITRQFEDQIKKDFDFELLELHYLPHSFGSGTKAYRINGRNLKIVFEGREGAMQVFLSGPHQKYDASKWTLIFEDAATAFTDAAIEEIISKIKNITT